MKTVGIVFLWTLAIAIAVVLLLRFGRRRKIVLRGRLVPRLARIVVVVLVALGATAENARGEDPKAGPKQAGKAQSDAPELLDRRFIANWRGMVAELPRFKRDYAQWRLDPTARPAPIQRPPARGMRLPARLRALLTEEAVALRAGKPAPAIPVGRLLAALAEAEARGFVDGWAATLVWGWLEAGKAPGNAAEEALTAQLLQRLHRFARLANCLLQAKAEVKPIDFAPRVWASKGGPKRDTRLREEKARKDLLAAARRLWSQSDAGPWERGALVGLEVAAGSPAAWIVRAETGARTGVAPGSKLQLTRLDLLHAKADFGPLVLRHTWLGEIRVEAGETLRSWDLVRRLGPDARETLKRAVDRALDGHDGAAALLESALPLTHRAIRAGLKQKPNAKGAPGLRLILALYTS